MGLIDHLIYAGLWASFGLAHSVLASQRVKQATASWLGHRYRFIYNVVATVHVVLILAIGRFVLSVGAEGFGWPTWLMTSLIAMQILGGIILILALRQYDLGLFLGTTQWRNPDREEKVEPLRTDGLNRWVRHPLYFGAHLLLWGGVSDPFTLATACWASLYFWIGAKYEERRLVALYGADYTAYQAKVPFQFPWPRPKHKA